MRLTKIYTKVGDKGTTLLAGGERVSKAHLRIEAYGTVDELNSVIGLLRDTLNASIPSQFASIDAQLFVIQNELFDLGSELATQPKALNLDRQKVVTADDVSRLEREIDAMNEDLQPLANFVLPGGYAPNSLAHLGRTVCRRAERLVVRLRESEVDIRIETQIYLNRLSDWLFVLSRTLSRLAGAPEVLWDQHRVER